MTAVSGVTGTNATTQSGSTGSGSNVTADYNTFLQLLITQLKNQDPTNPVDNTEQIAQLASFSAVEQQTQTNQKLDLLLTYAGLDKASSMIGKQITSADGEVSGIVQSVSLGDDGLVATLTSGDTVTVTSGVQIADAPSETSSGT
ncbi:MAG: flagellar hook assembly protein FlgD [Salaquimonas sp.]|jgi:flagellar basal-body rod modification protein FlgD|nr:flagellar hook assembly protein FlgD [Salaquimonas sp.]